MIRHLPQNIHNIVEVHKWYKNVFIEEKVFIDS